jgi:hypothetical protein
MLQSRRKGCGGSRTSNRDFVGTCSNHRMVTMGGIGFVCLEDVSCQRSTRHLEPVTSLHDDCGAASRPRTALQFRSQHHNMECTWPVHLRIGMMQNLLQSLTLRISESERLPEEAIISEAAGGIKLVMQVCGQCQVRRCVLCPSPHLSS